MNQMQTHGLLHSSKKSLGEIAKERSSSKRSMDDIVEEHLKPIKLAFKMAADPECAYCYGRGYTGQIKETLILVPCPKCINLEKLKNDCRKKELEKTKTGTETENEAHSQTSKQQDESKNKT